MPILCGMCNSHITNGGTCDRYSQYQKVRQIDDIFSLVGGGCPDFKGVEKTPIEDRTKDNILFTINNEEKYNNLLNIYNNIKIDIIENNNEKTTYKTDNKKFLEIATTEKIISIMDLEKNKLQMVHNTNDLKSIIEKMEIKGGKDVLYYIYVNGSKMCFDVTEMLTINKWREKLLSDCKIVMGLRTKKHREEFDFLIASLMVNASEIWVDEESDDEIYASIILEEINKLIKVEDKKSFKRNMLSYFIVDGSKLIKSSTIHQIIQNKNIKLTMRNVREILRSELTQNSKQINIDNGLVSVWFFKNIEECDEN